VQDKTSNAPRSNPLLRRQRSKRLTLAFAALVVAVFLSVGAPYTTRQLSNWELLPRVQHFTELSFANSQNLPKQYTPSMQQHVSFTLHNKEGKQMHYSYVALQTNENGTVSYSLASATVTLAAGQSKTVALTLSPTDMGARSKIVMSLASPHQSISYWVTRRAQ
jgi:VCBS repeat-containing protein